MAPNTPTEWILTWVALPFAIAGAAFSLYGVRSNLKHYHKPEFQRYAVRIHLMIPVYVTNASGYLSFFQNCYQGFVIANFFLLMQQCLGGRAGLVRLIAERPPIKRGRACWCLWEREDKKIEKPYAFYLTYKRRSMQFVLVMPLIGLLTIFLNAAGKWDWSSFDPSNAFVWLAAAQLASALTAMLSTDYFLSVLSDDIARVAPKAKLKAKFWCVKSTVFLSFLQYFLISLIFYLIDPDTEEFTPFSLQQCIICIELAFASLAHVKYFSWKEYVDDVVGLPSSSTNSGAPWQQPGDLSISDAMKDSLTVSDVYNITAKAFLEESADTAPDDTTVPLLRSPTTSQSAYIYGASTPGITPGTTPVVPVVPVYYVNQPPPGNQ